jgi:hypothetical protein
MPNAPPFDIAAVSSGRPTSRHVAVFDVHHRDDGFFSASGSDPASRPDGSETRPRPRCIA